MAETKLAAAIEWARKEIAISDAQVADFNKRMAEFGETMPLAHDETEHLRALLAELDRLTALVEEAEKGVDELEQLAWDEAEKQLALYDAGQTTYGHHAAEFIAKAIRSFRARSFLSKLEGEA